jgi:hypothetical protein
MRAVIFFTMISMIFGIRQGLPEKSCKDCKFYKLVRSSNDYKVITPSCSAYKRDLNDDTDFLNELFSKKIVLFISCIESRNDNDKCGINGKNFVHHTIQSPIVEKKDINVFSPSPFETTRGPIGRVELNIEYPMTEDITKLQLLASIHEVTRMHAVTKIQALSIILNNLEEISFDLKSSEENINDVTKKLFCIIYSMSDFENEFKFMDVQLDDQIIKYINSIYTTSNY